MLTEDPVFFEELSVRARSACLSLKLASVEQLVNYYRHNRAIRIQNCGATTDRELLHFCLRNGLELQQVKLQSENRELKKYFDLRLDYLKPYLQHKLFDYLVSRNILTIGQLYNLDINKTASFNDISAELVKKLVIVKKDFENDSKKIINTIEKHEIETLLPIDDQMDMSVLPNDALSALHQVLFSYLELYGDTTMSKIANMRYGFSGERTMYEEIGAYFNKTREWARLKTVDLMSKIARLIEGKCIAKPFCSIRQEYIDCLKSTKMKLLPEYAVDKDTVLYRMAEVSNCTATQNEGLFDILLEVLNIPLFSIGKENL